LPAPIERFVDRPTLDLVEMRRERERVKRLAGEDVVVWPDDLGTGDGFVYR
jgi:hypothetical protein